MRTKYIDAKKAFIDEIRVDEYIDLAGSSEAYFQLENSLNERLKMVLLYGEPGTGKTMLLSRLYEQYKHQLDLHLVDTPSGTRREFYEKLFTIFTGQVMPEDVSVDLETFVSFAKRIRGERDVTILLDEAQMYPKEMLEEIRILSDTGSIKFIISFHKINDEETIGQKHFTSRIWESVELRNANRDETRRYIHQRLIMRDMMGVADMLKDRQVKLIHRLTNGNLRETNKLLYTAFDIADYYQNSDPRSLHSEEFPIKILEMAAIKTGLIHV